MMKGRLTSWLFYCGVSKDEYNSVKKDAYISNFKVWKYLHIFIAASFAVLVLESALYNGLLFTGTVIRFGMMIYSALVAFLFFKKIKADSLIGQLIIYLTMLLLLSVAFWYGLLQREMMAVSFIAMLVIISMFMIDKPYYMAIVIIGAMSLYISHVCVLKEGNALVGDVANVLIYGLLGIIINTFYNSIRVREFLLAKRNEAHIKEQEETVKRTTELNDALQKMSASLVEVLGDIVESRDSDSGAHVQRVRGYTYLLANRVMEDFPEYGLDKYTVNLMTFASALHDVGKIAIPDAILLKPGRLTEDEWKIMKTHSEKGCEILNKMAKSWSRDYLNMGLDICMYHHEKWDGKGYPKGLRGDEIPISAQIVSLADSYDAISSKRVYKDAYSSDKAYEMIMNGECGAFSDKLLACFAKCRADFERHSKDPTQLDVSIHRFDVIGSGSGSSAEFVVGLHDDDRDPNDKDSVIIGLMNSDADHRAKKQ